MDFIKNFPFFSIMCAMFCGVINSVLKGKASKYFTITVSLIVTALSFVTLMFTVTQDVSFVYLMGHWPAPWGNEIRAGAVEALTATVFSAIIFFILLGSSKYTEEIEDGKHHHFYMLTALLLGALLSLVYTNDMFTAYVFIEINTIAACGFIMIRRTGKAVASAIQYMTMSLLGSGLVLIGICLLYTITGHLLMEDICVSIQTLVANGQYTVPLTVTIGLITVGLCIKSGLYPFHLWIPDAYSNSLPSSSAVLSGLASKGYIFLLIKIYYRVIGLESIISSNVLNIIFICGIVAMLMGSVHALMQNDVRKMSAFCSVSHIGYIFTCIGLGTDIGMCAAILHMFTHALTKSNIFLAIAGLADVSGRPGENMDKESNAFENLRGAGLRNKVSGLSFMFGAFSMIGIPLFAGFASKLLIGIAAFSAGTVKTVVVMVSLAVSTILMVGYFLRVLVQLYLPTEDASLPVKKISQQKRYAVSMLLFAAANIFIGLCSAPIVEMLEAGIKLFGIGGTYL